MKKFKFLVGAVALFAIVVVNVWNAMTTVRGSDLSLADVEALANPEGMESRGFWTRDGDLFNFRATTTTFTYEDGSVSEVTTLLSDKLFICVDGVSDNCQPGVDKRIVTDVTYSFYDRGYKNGQRVSNYETLHFNNRPH